MRRSARYSRMRRATARLTWPAAQVQLRAGDLWIRWRGVQVAVESLRHLADLTSGTKLGLRFSSQKSSSRGGFALREHWR